MTSRPGKDYYRPAGVHFNEYNTAQKFQDLIMLAAFEFADSHKVRYVPSE